MKTQNQYQIRRYAKDQVYRARMRLRSRLTYMLKNKQHTSRGSELAQALGTSFSEARSYIESQFSEDMSWENYGQVWEIDHIVALRTARTVEEVHQLFYYMNLQPKFVSDNRPGRLYKDVTVVNRV